MSSSPRHREVKKAQRESFLLREISSLFLQITYDESRFAALVIYRVELSPEGSVCTVFFFSLSGGRQTFDELMPDLILYKPSMRTALAKASSRRYVPQLVFTYAENLEKQRRVDDLIDTLKKEGKL